MLPDIFLYYVVLPVMGLCAMALPLLLVPRTIPAAATAGIYLVGYMLAFGRLPAGNTPPAREAWHVLFPAAVLAGVLAVLIELIPERWKIRLPAFVAAAVAVAIVAVPQTSTPNPHVAAYIALTAATSVAWFAALRLPARLMPPPAPLIVLSVVSFVFGAMISFAGIARQGQPALVLSVPLGAFAFFTVFRPVRPLAAAALTPACLILPAVGAMAFFFRDRAPGEPLVSTSAFVLTAVAPLAVLVAVIPQIRTAQSRWQPWVAASLPAVLALGMMGGAFAVAPRGTASGIGPQPSEPFTLPGAEGEIRKSPYRTPPPGPSDE